MHGTLIAASLVTVTLVLGGCSSSPRTVTVGEAQNGQMVDLRLGDTLAVSLPANPSTGYSWEVVESPEPVLVPTGSWEFVHGRTDVVGAPGIGTLRLRAATPGAVALRLGYRRPWEDPQSATTTWQCDVSVK